MTSPCTSHDFRDSDPSHGEQRSRCFGQATTHPRNAMPPVTHTPEQAAGTAAEHPPEDFDYAAAEGFAERERDWRAWMMVGLGLTSLLAVLALIVAIAKLAGSGDGNAGAMATTAAPAA